MTNATPQRALLPELALPHAVIIAGALVAIAVIVAGLASIDKPPRFTANPQGGVWIEHNDTLYLCRASRQGAAPCINLADGTTITFADLSR